MRFQAAHKLVTYLLTLAAFATLASAGTLDGATALGFLALVAASWPADAGGKVAALVDRAATPARLAVGVIVAATAWLVARRAPDPDLLPVLRLVLLLLALKLFHRRSHRDDVHVLVLSFLLVLAGGALGGRVLFAAAFVAYVLLATWALLLFHLRREMEENYLVKHSAQAPSQKVGVARILNSRRIVGGPFFAATAAVALGVVAGAIATFVLVPRVGAGLVLGGRRAPNVVGFSDDVSLGQYGTLAAGSGAVALRATVPRIAALPTETAREDAAERLYWRGTVYDSYDGGHWTRARVPALRTTLVGHGELAAIGIAGALATGEALAREHAAVERQEIAVVALSVPVAFALDRPVAFEAPPPADGASASLQLVPRWSDEVALRAGPVGAPVIADADATDPADAIGELRATPGSSYVAYSIEGPATNAPALSDDARAAYLQLPPALAPKLGDLVERVAPAGRPAAQVDALAAWLRATHSYTLDLPRPAPGVDPVLSFLFETPSGHCEYFASAMALLLRARGIPSRYVNGYLGGEWNDVGRYVAVRDGRAHSWVEAYLPDTGWTRVDATPSLPAPARAGKLRQALDSLDFAWSRWIVSYDLPRQLDLARGVAHRLGLASPSAPRGHLPTLVVVLAAVAAMAIAAARLMPSRRVRPQRASAAVTAAARAPATRLYDRALA
ncbi:MAG TPA: transglutaminaseTgpA domain-containing protein, partial [Polyangia bacterium]|nr:transglutaminaseTgpA domain-containing protein [Polyangia bacterium]